MKTFKAILLTILALGLLGLAILIGLVLLLFL
jgi:hypothetical protein